MQAAVDQFFECHAIVLGDSSKADMDFVLVILGADVERRALVRASNRTNPCR